MYFEGCSSIWFCLTFSHNKLGFRGAYSGEGFSLRQISGYMASAGFITGDLDLDHSYKVVSASFLPCPFAVFPFLYPSLEESHQVQLLYMNGRGHKLNFLGSVQIHYLEFFPQEILSLLPRLFICSFTHSLISV